ncbi:MAG: hypothetical protein AB1546_04650 [bacterium]
MGYATVFWIREEPIRQAFVGLSSDDIIAEHPDILKEIGSNVFKLIIGYPGDPLKYSYRGHEDVFCRVETAIHSTWFAYFVWTGQDLIYLPYSADPSDAVTLDHGKLFYEIESRMRKDRVVKTLSGKEQNERIKLAMARGESAKKVETENSISSAYASIYWAYQDWSRGYNFKEPDESEMLTLAETGEWPEDYLLRRGLHLPSQEVGHVIYRQMTNRMDYGSENFRHEIHKVATITKSEFAVFVWHRNCLRHILDLPELFGH